MWDKGSFSLFVVVKVGKTCLNVLGKEPEKKKYSRLIRESV